MNTGSFSMILFILIVVVGGYLIFTEQVEGRSKMILIGVIVVITIMLVLNLGLFSNKSKILDSPVAANSAIDPLTKYNYTDNYSLSTWIFVNDWTKNNGVAKPILTRTMTASKFGESDGTTHSNPQLYLDPYENQLNIDFLTMDDGHTGKFNTNTINVPNINTQKWVNIVCCFSDQHIDTYINGKLVKTTIPENQLYYNSELASTATELTINVSDTDHPFAGSISNTAYYDHFLSPQDVWNSYQKGFSSNMLGNYLNKYNASFTFYENQNQVGQFFIM